MGGQHFRNFWIKGGDVKFLGLWGERFCTLQNFDGGKTFHKENVSMWTSKNQYLPAAGFLSIFSHENQLKSPFRLINLGLKLTKVKK